ncbi:MAG: autotransporter domain-containing protein [Syntrophorhabdaceae bacterium]|nr:autotransporter domain-containing protein [Syntrophorhabdaceae bacterium]
MAVYSRGDSITTGLSGSPGILAQSVGGGGGAGGGAVSVAIWSSKQQTTTTPAIAYSMGGNGGQGGAANAVSVENHSNISTGTASSSQPWLDWANSPGILAQSIGGGGGHGGFSVSSDVSLTKYNTYQGGASISLGGSGGSGNIAGPVSVTSDSNSITTKGDYSWGIHAQSVGGGGGAGGFSVGFGISNSTQFSASVGGSGGSGGNADTVNVNNSSSISTGWVDNQNNIYGNQSAAILAQSIGGGGGAGGFSVTGNVAIDGSMDPKLKLGGAGSGGGSGGQGGNAKDVTITHGGLYIQTQGDYSPGIHGQSIGGGGGAGGFSVTGNLTTSPPNGSPYNAGASVSLGGSGGYGGVGGSVTINNTTPAAKITTNGNQSPGIFAQSIGGGGGHGGFSVAGSLTIGTGALGLAIGGEGGNGNTGGNVTVADQGGQITTAGAASPGIFAQSIGGGGGSGNFGVGLGIGTRYISGTIISSLASLFGSTGGNGATGGNAGQIAVSVRSAITTSGKDSPAILAQSIGGGGGSAGFDLRGQLQGGSSGHTLNLGAKQGTSGSGNNVQVSNIEMITTTGPRSSGIIAQSIGGGGGLSWVSIDDNTYTPSQVSVTLGAQGGSSGSAGLVKVDNPSPISVSGAGSFGIIAQSIGGGGGIGSIDAIGSSGTVTIGGSQNSSGDGGNVQVNNDHVIVTEGAGSYGILAQSIGGGGGVVLNTQSGQQKSLQASLPSGDGTNSGSGGSVQVSNNYFLYTFGQGAIGIAAQSIGGGGGIDIINGKAGSAQGTGSGGNVSISNSNTIKTEGDYAHAIFAQSAGGKGNGGPVTINNSSTITVKGNQANAIWAISSGSQGQGQITINNNTGASIIGAPDGTPPIKLTGGTNNVINNQGTITAVGEPVQGTYSTFNQTGNLTCGSLTINLGSGGGTSSTYNLNGGTLNTKALSLLYGTFNQGGGTLQVSDAMTVGPNVSPPSSTSPSYYATYTLNNGTLQANDLYVMTGGIVSLEGGTASYTTLHLNGGVFKNDLHTNQPGSSMNVNGNFQGNITNQGTLSGSGTVTGSVTNNGTVNPGNSPGTLTIVGSYTQAPTGNMIIDVASATSYDNLVVTGVPGTASLAGSVTPTLLGGYIPKGNQVFSGFITATGGVIGTFDTIASRQITPTLFWQTRYNPTSVDLLVQRQYNNSSLGLNANQQSVGRMLDRFAGVTSGDMNTVLNTIDVLPTAADVRNAYKQISPEKVGALSTLAFTGTSFQMRQQAQRVSNLRLGSQAAEGIGSSLGAFNLRYSSNQGMMLAYNGSNLAGLGSLPSKASATSKTPWGFYIYPSLTFGQEGSSENQTGFKYTAADLTAGVDLWMQENLMGGIATGYRQTNAHFKNNGGNVEAKTWPITTYAAYLGNSWYGYGSLGYNLNLFDIERNIIFGNLNRRAKGNTTGHQLNAYTEAGYDIKTQDFIFTPMASLAYSSLWVDGYGEDGASALNLRVRSQKADSFQTGLGLRVAVPIKYDTVKAVPQAYISYQHEFSSTSRGIKAHLSQGETFVWYTDDTKNDFAIMGVRLDILTGKNFQLGINYNAEVRRGNAPVHSIFGGLRWEF